MPNTTIDGTRAVVVALGHGVTIRWGGRNILNCSSVGAKINNNHVYGTYFGTKT